VSEYKEEYRKHPRKEYGAVGTLIIDETSYSCIIMDISKGGALVSLGLSSQISEGCALEIRIPYTNKNKVLIKKAKVIRASAKGVALRFIDPTCPPKMTCQ
jgi:hypothetical protein